MKFGICTFVTDETIRPSTLAVALEERGFDSLFLAEHSHIPASRETPYPGGGELPRYYYRTLDPFVALTAAATVTDRLRLGTGIALAIQRDPIHLAKEVASLDLVSGGRVSFGVGVGWNREEMRDHGTDPRTRGARLNEQLAAMTELWTKDEAEFHGKFVDFGPAFAWPKPVQQPRPPIFVGGDSPAALARVAAHGDGWMPNAKRQPDEIRDQIARAAEALGPNARLIGAFARATPEIVEAYQEGGAEELDFVLVPGPTADVQRTLDKIATIIAPYR
jgi:probable F420-dependent oxidoreductase